MDKYKLEYFLKSKNMSIEDLCSALDISKTAYYRKTNGKSDFYRNEILKIRDLLQLSGQDVLDIFFTSKVS